MGVIQRFIDRNKEFVSKFRHGDKAMPPAQHLAVLTCMDARIHPEQALGLEIGDAHMIRNAGGRASDDAIRSLVISTPSRTSSRACATTSPRSRRHSSCPTVSK